MSRASRLRSRLRSTSPTDQALRIALGLMLLSGAVAGTSASFNGSTTNSASTYATDAVYGPTSATASPSAKNVVVTYPSGTLGSGSTSVHHRVYEKYLGTGSLDGQTPPSCPAYDGTWTLSTATPDADLTWQDDNVAVAAKIGSWYCYRVQASYPQGASPVWFSDTAAMPAASTQIGHAIRSVEFVNGNGSPNNLGDGDSIVFRFIQPVTTTSDVPVNGTHVICARSNNDKLNVGRTGTGQCTNGETVVVGKITVGNIVTTTTWETTWTWSDCAGSSCSTLTAGLGTSTDGGPATDVTFGTPVFVPVSTMFRSATGDLTLCAGANDLDDDAQGNKLCRPTPYGTP